jgi:HlyD family secretion protein
MKRFLIVLLVLAAAAGGVGYWYAHASAAQGPAFRTEAVGRGDLAVTITATGTLEPEDVVDVGAQVAGQIREFGRDPQTGKPIDYGSVVKPGAVLAQIDDALYRAKVDQSRALLNQAERKVEQARAKVQEAKARAEQAKANVKRAEADLAQGRARLNQSERDYGRARPLTSTQAISKQEYDQYLATYETSQAGVGVYEAALAQAQASQSEADAAVTDAEAAVGDAQAAADNARAVLQQDEVNLGYCTIRSPIDGVILDRRVTIGQTVQSSFNTPSLFLIAKDLQRMKVWASVNEADIGQVHVGQKVRFTVDAHPQDTFEGVVNLVRLNATMTQNVVTYTVEVLADNPQNKLLPYLTANLQFEVSNRSQALLVPNAALRWRPALAQVAPDARPAFAERLRRKEARQGAAAGADRQGRGVVWVQDGALVRPVKVRLGLSDGNHTEVIDGDLKEGTRVVTGAAAQAGGEDTTNPFAPQLFGGRKQQ